MAMVTIENSSNESKKRLQNTAAGCRVRTGDEEGEEGRVTHIKT